MTLPVPPATIVILVAVTLGTVTDLKTRKIYNWITFPAAALGLFLNSLPPDFCSGGTGFSGATLSIASCALGMLLTAGPNLIRNKSAIHNGDVKLWGAIGACLLPVPMLLSWFYFSIFYGLVSTILVSRAKVKSGDATAARKALIPLCPMIAAGTYLGVFCGRPLMHLMGFNWYQV